MVTADSPAMAERSQSGVILQRLEELAASDELAKYERYFPIAQRGADVFIGVRMGEAFALAKHHVGMPLGEIEALLETPIHEARVVAVSVMDFEARAKKTTPERKTELFELYLRRHDRINTWDLVDRSAISVVGGYLADKPRDVLYELAQSTRWFERRTPATMPRTTLRYAIEKLPQDQRKHYLGLKSRSPG
jgi:hypothetical protein